MPFRGTDHSLRRRPGLGGLLGAGGRCDRGGGQRERLIAELRNGGVRGFWGRPGVNMGLGLVCRTRSGRGGLRIVDVDVDVDAGMGA
jgi:hypothetical protein